MLCLKQEINHAEIPHTPSKIAKIKRVDHTKCWWGFHFWELPVRNQNCDRIKTCTWKPTAAVQPLYPSLPQTGNNARVLQQAKGQIPCGASTAQYCSVEAWEMSDATTRENSSCHTVTSWEVTCSMAPIRCPSGKDWMIVTEQRSMLTGVWAYRKHGDFFELMDLFCILTTLIAACSKSYRTVHTKKQFYSILIFFNAHILPSEAIPIPFCPHLSHLPSLEPSWFPNLYETLITRTFMSVT